MYWYSSDSKSFSSDAMLCTGDASKCVPGAADRVSPNLNDHQMCTEEVRATGGELGPGVRVLNSSEITSICFRDWRMGQILFSKPACDPFNDSNDPSYSCEMSGSTLKVHRRAIFPRNAKHDPFCQGPGKSNLFQAHALIPSIDIPWCCQREQTGLMIFT